MLFFQFFLSPSCLHAFPFQLADWSPALSFLIPFQTLDSSPLDPTQPLLLRSIGLERNGQVHEAARDVEKALDGKKTREVGLMLDSRSSSSHSSNLTRFLFVSLSCQTDSSQSDVQLFDFGSPSSRDCSAASC